MSSKPVLFACIIIFFSLALHSQSVSTCGNFSATDFQKTSFFFLSDEAPMTKALAKLPPVVSATDLILRHLERVENETLAHIKSGNPHIGDFIRPCKSESSQFVRVAEVKFGVRGWPPLVSSCETDTYGVKLSANEEPPYTTDDIFEAFAHRGNAIMENIRSVTSSIIGNFSNPDFPYNWSFTMPSRICILHSAAGYRIGDHWYLEHRLTNKSKDDYSLYRNRVMEYQRVVNNTLEHMSMCLPERPPQGEEHPLRERASTLLTTSFGPEDPFFFVESPSIETNSALIRSQEQSEHFTQLAQDVLVPSNIAILFLPMALNLVPISLITKVDTVKLLVYTLFSDILTVIPIGIKAVELITISSYRHRSIFVRMASSENGDPTESAAAQLHAAECRLNDNVKPVGITLLVVSIIGMIGGVIAEFMARNYVMKKTKRKQSKDDEERSSNSFRSLAELKFGQTSKGKH